MLCDIIINLRSHNLFNFHSLKNFKCTFSQIDQGIYILSKSRFKIF